MTRRRRHEPRLLEHVEFHFCNGLTDGRVGAIEGPYSIGQTCWIDAMRGQTTNEPRPTRHTIMAETNGKAARILFNGKDITEYTTGEYLITEIEPIGLVDQDALEKALNGAGPGDPILCRLGWHRGWTPWSTDEPGLKSRCCDRCFTTQVRPTT